MIFDKTQTLILLNLCEQVYVFANTGHCSLPLGFASPTAIRLPVEGRPLLLRNDNLDIFGFVTSKDGVAYIVFRGTQILSGFDFAAEWALDTLALPLRAYGAGNVHLGFYDAWMSLSFAVKNAVSASIGGNGTQKLTVIGHSLGAALATLCWTDLGGDLLTFACPRVGDLDFATSLWAGQTIRVVNTPDVVPKVPTDPPFRHGGQEIIVAGPPSPAFAGFLDLNLDHVAHALESYRAGLESLP